MIVHLSDERFRRLIEEMEQDPKGYGRVDMERVLQRIGYTRHQYEGHDIYLRQGCRPFHLRTTQADVPEGEVLALARVAMTVLGGS